MLAISIGRSTCPHKCLGHLRYQSTNQCRAGQEGRRLGVRFPVGSRMKTDRADAHSKHGYSGPTVRSCKGMQGKRQGSAPLLSRATEQRGSSPVHVHSWRTSRPLTMAESGQHKYASLLEGSTSWRFLPQKVCLTAFSSRFSANVQLPGPPSAQERHAIVSPQTSPF